jgi:hypothetical protein
MIIATEHAHKRIKQLQDARSDVRDMCLEQRKSRRASRFKAQVALLSKHASIQISFIARINSPFTRLTCSPDSCGPVTCRMKKGSIPVMPSIKRLVGQIRPPTSTFASRSAPAHPILVEYARVKGCHRGAKFETASSFMSSDPGRDNEASRRLVREHAMNPDPYRYR